MKRNVVAISSMNMKCYFLPTWVCQPQGKILFGLFGSHDQSVNQSLLPEALTRIGLCSHPLGWKRRKVKKSDQIGWYNKATVNSWAGHTLHKGTSRRTKKETKARPVLCSVSTLAPETSARRGAFSWFTQSFQISQHQPWARPTVTAGHCKL